jgi:FKBP-type peptidyl-prolyl cis-trans isomerase
MRSFFYLLLLGVALGTIAIVVRSGIFARRDPGRPINSAMREAMNADHPQLSSDDAMLVAKTYANARKSPSGLQWVVRDPGTGVDTPAVGTEIICNYDGRLLDGTPFDSSFRRGVPFTFRLGSGGVIKGWDEAFGTMHKGEKRTLIVPHWLGYGEKGAGNNIPGRATLIFEVELLDWR